MAAQDDPQALRASLEVLQREHAIARMRLAEALGYVERELEETTKLRQQLADAGAEVVATGAELAATSTELAAARAEHSRLAADMAAATAERDRHAATLAQHGHRFITRAGAFLDRHPIVRGALMPFVRLALRITGRR